MSGGIDSSMAAVILKKNGWQPVGVSLRMKTGDNFIAAKRVCRALNIPHYTLDVRAEFKRMVIDYFLRAYKSGRTPNPCVVCNSKLKFNQLIRFAKARGIDYVATGHYARIKPALIRAGEASLRSGASLRAGASPAPTIIKPVGAGLAPALIGHAPGLHIAKDRSKDQTYYLSFLNQTQLAKIIFPLGDYTKKQIYQLAAKPGFNFLTEKKQSQDFCFLGGGSLAVYLSNQLKSKPGKIVDTDGKILGAHPSLSYYTIGQRQGLKLSGGPYYVVGFNRRKNYLIVSKSEKDLYSEEALLKKVHFISGQLPKNTIHITAKIRYQHVGAPAKLVPFTRGQFKLIFNQPQRALTPGQFAVFYQGEVCLGGGEIFYAAHGGGR